MFKRGVHQCPDHIISIFQLQVRLIVRGKAGENVEFVVKIGVSIVKGYNFIDLTAGMPTTKAQTSSFTLTNTWSVGATSLLPSIQTRYI